MQSKNKRKIGFESEEKRTIVLDKIIGFFQKERNEEIGIIAAEAVLDFFLQDLGEEIYKRAMADAKKLLKAKFEDLDIELDSLVL